MKKMDFINKFPAPDLQQWHALVDKALNGKPFRETLIHRTYDDIEIEPLYSPVVGNIPADKLQTSDAHWTRGIALSTSEPSWEIHQMYAGPTIEKTKADIAEDIVGGTEGIHLQLASPGQFGVPANSLANISMLMDQDMGSVRSVSLNTGSEYTTVAGDLFSLWSSKPFAASQIRCDLNADPLGSLARHGSLPVSFDQAKQQLGTLCARVHDKDLPFTVLAADGRPYHNAGASDAQELAAILKTLVTYLRWLEMHKILPEQTLALTTVQVSVDSDFFTSISKLRALRQLIYRLGEACGCADVALNIRCFAFSSERMLSRYDSHTNMLRLTSACASAAIGGADAILLLPFSWVEGQTTSFARRMARNTQIILREESGLGQITDSPGGSGYVTHLTQALAEKSWSIFQQLENEGSLESILQSGSIQRSIRNTANRRLDNLAILTDEITGINAFPNLTSHPKETISEHPPAKDEVDVAVTAETLPLRRLAEPFETVRDFVEEKYQENGTRPCVLAFILDEEKNTSDLVDFGKNIFAIAGLDLKRQDSPLSENESPETLSKIKNSVVCIVGSDNSLNHQGIEQARLLREAGASRILMIVRPGNKITSFRDAGVDGFLYRGANILEELSFVIQALGLSKRLSFEY